MAAVSSVCVSSVCTVGSVGLGIRSSSVVTEKAENSVKPAAAKIAAAVVTVFVFDALAFVSGSYSRFSVGKVRSSSGTVHSAVTGSASEVLEYSAAFGASCGRYCTSSYDLAMAYFVWMSICV